MPSILGISAHAHDSACCVLRDGWLVAAAQEERFSRLKHDGAMPRRAFRYCLDEAALRIDEIDCVAYFEDAALKHSRRRWADPDTITVPDSMQPEREIRDILGYEGPIATFQHHHSHAASAFFYSGFESAAVLSIDGVGEWATTTYGQGRGADLEIVEEVRFPHSIGLLYSTITAYLGFAVNDSEYKVMGLAPYGTPSLLDAMQRLIRIGDDGQFELDLRFFDFLDRKRMYSDALVELLGQPPRAPGTKPDAFAADIASSLQALIERVILAKVAYLHRRIPSDDLCLAGGVALNCVANGRIVREAPFRRVFVQPAADDAGGALGAAALAHVRMTGRRPATGPMRHAYLGPCFSSDEIARDFAASGEQAAIDFRNREPALLQAACERIAEGKIVGWFHGRMEFGPRALGARSILADPRRHDMRDRINTLIKRREEFRPFAPCVLEHRAAGLFELDRPSPFMTLTCRVLQPERFPAVTHVDGSARVQTVDAEASPRLFRLLSCFERLTGCPVLLNTSLNMNAEPIVCSPSDAIICFLRSGLDVLVLEDFLLDRETLPVAWPRWFERLAGGPSLSSTVYAAL